jgi:Sel1 repeat
VTRATAIVLIAATLGATSACGAGIAQERNARLFELHHRLAEEGDLKAAVVVGSLYLQGIGVAPDFEKSVYWYERGGPVGGWEALGTVFQYREPPDYPRAAAYYRKAADLCSPVALYELGVLESEGRLGPADDLAAYTWVMLARWAASQAPGCRQHVSCLQLALEDRPGRAQLLQQRLTSTQIVNAEERVERWKRAHPWARGTVRCTPSGA